ncbi:MAG: hypothetical protein MUP22_00495 [Desulfobacterales bacterium]|nr:hypothetical protein [Desulfobacterales bacterium]
MKGPEEQMEILLKIGGIYNLAFAVFHCLFWKIFKWDSELSQLNVLNRAIMQVLNLCLIFCFLIFFYISVFHTSDLLSTPLGQSILICISIFWLLRAMEQILFFKLKHWGSVVFLIIFIFGAVIYLIPVFSN